jgi:hypothetical protein
VIRRGPNHQYLEFRRGGSTESEAEAESEAESDREQIPVSISPVIAAGGLIPHAPRSLATARSAVKLASVWVPHAWVDCSRGKSLGIFAERIMPRHISASGGGLWLRIYPHEDLTGVRWVLLFGC